MIKEDIDWVEEVAKHLDNIYTMLYNVSDKIGELEAGQDIILKNIDENIEEDSIEKIIEEFEQLGWIYYPVPSSPSLDFRFYTGGYGLIFDEMVIGKSGISISVHSSLSIKAISLINRIYKLWSVEV